MHLGCNVDCEGGGVSIELAHRDRSTLVRLARAKLDECRSLITDREELAAMRHK